MTSPVKPTTDVKRYEPENGWDSVMQPRPHMKESPNGQYVGLGDYSTMLESREYWRELASEKNTEIASLTSRLQEAQEQLAAAIEDSARAKNAQREAEEEIRGIDSVLARRPALANCKTRREMVELACVTAGKATDEVTRLTAEVEELKKVLERIAAYGVDGICPYGCDTPNIAAQALTRRSLTNTKGE